MITIYLSFVNIMRDKEKDNIEKDGSFSVRAESGRFILYFRQLEVDLYELKKVKDVEKNITYNSRSKKHNLKEIDLQTSCGYGNIISFKIERVAMGWYYDTYIIPLEKVYLKPSEYCYFKSKRSVFYKVENDNNKYLVTKGRTSKRVRVTKEIMENIKLV